MSGKEIEIKGSLKVEEAAAYLRSLADCLQAGKLVLQKGGEYLSLSPVGQLDLELESSVKKGREKISLELSWRTDLCEPQQLGLTISSQDPPQPEPAQPEAAAEAPQPVPELAAPPVAPDAAAPAEEDKAKSGKPQRR